MIRVIGPAGNGSRELVRQLLAGGAATSRLAHTLPHRAFRRCCAATPTASGQLAVRTDRPHAAERDAQVGDLRTALLIPLLAQAV